MAKAKYKPLSFSTTMRNPNRIADFLNCLLPYEGKTLDNELIDKIYYNPKDTGSYDRAIKEYMKKLKCD